ncbi:dysbindin domain-containing protein 2-like isoform X2 [Ambystoma mexicanum]|uniref:dysbindin domain-containing protein 2-like isoform X2 n=1 Tax=Ambystoma mexicanum TaxID=8296 RepID=UPI0037E95ACB
MTGKLEAVVKTQRVLETAKVIACECSTQAGTASYPSAEASTDMSAPGAPGRRLPSEVDYIPRLRDLDPAQQQLRLRERQKFFEDVFQHEVDFFFPLNHLNIEHRRPPLDSVSSMEVNIDMLEQIETFDINDQDSLDVFLSSAVEEGTDASSFPGLGLQCRGRLSREAQPTVT